MTQETKTALELYAKYKRMKATLNQTEEQTRPLKNDIGGDLRYQLIHEDVKKLMDVGEELDQYCRGKPSIKRDLEAELQKIDAKIKKESNKFDSEHKLELTRLQETIRKSEKKTTPWTVVDSIISVLSWVLAIGWVVFYFVVIFSNPTDPTWIFLRKLFYSEIMLLVLLLPPALFVGLGAGLSALIDFITDSATSASLSAKKRIEAIQKEKAELIASVEKEKEDYHELLNRINN